MPRGKILKWRENAGFSCVHEPPVREIAAGGTYMRGRWREQVFGRPGRLTLELGCGRGEYTLALAARRPAGNYLGVDVKGHRFWHGARQVEEQGLANVAFLRARIEYIDHFFAPDEVDEIWLTFSDPQPRDDKGTRRITSPVFLRRYQRFLAPGGLVHVKTDSPFLYERTRDDLREQGIEIVVDCDDVHGRPEELPEELRDLLQVRTRYEEIWMAKGHRIRYLQLRP